MKTLKFRVWAAEDKRWELPMSLEVFRTSGHLECLYKDQDYVIEQYTGLLDRNGKEIFEGDIIQYEYDCKNNSFARIGFIQWSPAFAGEKYNVMNKDGTLGYDSFYGGIPNEDCEIIGNIHETPDLMDK